MDDFTLGLYLDARTIVDNPDYLKALRDQLGLNLVIVGFTGEIPKEVLAQSPFDGIPPSAEFMRSLLCTLINGQPITTKLDSVQKLVGPAVRAERDEGLMRQAIQAAHDIGLRVWLLGEAWTTSDWDNVMYCPSHEGVNRWYEALYVHMASHYDVEGLDITHARYPMTSHPRGMFVCACERCAQAAAEMGYNMPQMKAALYDALEKLKRIPAERLVRVARDGMGFSDYVQLLDLQSGVLDWFRFRADLLATKFGRFRQAVHAAAGESLVFGTDTYPASLALFAGHNYTQWDRFSDFASPLISHVDIFQAHTMVVWAEFLQSVIPGLGETDALQIIYRLVGYDCLDMPTRVADFLLGDIGIVPGFATNPRCEFEHLPLRELLALDMAKARLYLPEGLPSYPIIQGGGSPHDWPREIIEATIASAKELGHQGVMLQGTRALLDS